MIEPQRQRADKVTPRATQRLGQVPLRWRGVDSDGEEVTQRSWHDERVGADIGRAREQSFAARLERHPTFGQEQSDRPARGSDQPREKKQERRLANPRRPQNHGGRAGRDFEVEPAHQRHRGRPRER